MQRRLVEVHSYVVLHLRIFDIPVHVHYPGRGLKDLLNLLCQFDLLLVVRTVHFCNQGFEYGRTGWHLRYLDTRAVTVADLHQPRTQALGDSMALRAALVAVPEVHLDVGLVGAAPQEVMPHQPVEVVRTRRACIHLVVRDFRLLPQILP